MYSMKDVKMKTVRLYNGKCAVSLDPSEVERLRNGEVLIQDGDSYRIGFLDESLIVEVEDLTEVTGVDLISG